MDDFFSRELKFYFNLRRLRDEVSYPVVFILNKMKVTSDMVTYSSFLFFLFFFIALTYQNKWSIFFLLIGLSHDMFDGALARIQNKESDKGKFIDILFDSINFSIFILALVYVDILSGFVGALFILVLILSKILRIVYYSVGIPTDWFFKPVAGFMPILLMIFSYIVFLGHYFGSLGYIDYYFIIFSVVAILDAIYFYSKILKKV